MNKKIKIIIKKIEKVGLPKDPTANEKEYKNARIYEAGFNRAKKVILYLIKETERKEE